MKNIVKYAVYLDILLMGSMYVIKYICVMKMSQIDLSIILGSLTSLHLNVPSLAGNVDRFAAGTAPSGAVFDSPKPPAHCQVEAMACIVWPPYTQSVRLLDFRAFS